ncbi:MAG: 3-hydroxyacyl-CoA dehydrogenase NAD-binding domain-containing protein [Betaproteobacteria bacterium]
MPIDSPPTDQHVAIVGGGTMGADIAALFLAGGWTAHIYVRPGVNRDSLTSRVQRSLKQLGRGNLRALLVVGELRDLAAVPVDLAIETVSENLPLKQKVFAELESLLAPETPLTSNSSSYPISRIGEGLRTQQRMLGLHFFMPAHVVPLVEVVHSERTDPAVGRRVFDIMGSLGSKPVMVQKDIVGFLANRLQHALMREAWSLVERGIATPADIDTAVRFGFGFRYIAAGPFLQKDLSGLDTHYAASSSTYPDLCNDVAPVPLLVSKIAEGALGMKCGKGIYDWPASKAAAEKLRYERALSRGLDILRSEGDET